MNLGHFGTIVYFILQVFSVVRPHVFFFKNIVPLILRTFLQPCTAEDPNIAPPTSMCAVCTLGPVSPAEVVRSVVVVFPFVFSSKHLPFLHPRLMVGYFYVRSCIWLTHVPYLSLARLPPSVHIDHLWDNKTATCPRRGMPPAANLGGDRDAPCSRSRVWSGSRAVE